LITLSFDTAREILSDSDALELVSALMPIYMHSVERVMSYENESRVAYLSGQLQTQQKKIERVDRSKSNFVSVAGHEFKTPLTLVEGYAAMLSDSLLPEEEGLHQLLQGIHNGTRRLRELVDDMIDVSMLDNNLMSLNFQPVWLSRSLNLLKADCQQIVGQRQQMLEVRSFAGADELFFADPERLYQALRNIISNAIKYTPDGGHITIDGRMMPGFIEVTVTDTGIGIAPENQDAIFEKFGQLGDVSLHSSGKTKFKGGGPGLGLPIAKGIIEAHGGTIWVESEGYDEFHCPGTTFHILLPERSQPNDPQLAKLFAAVTDSQTVATDNQTEKQTF
jgi:signal transduction histidine kinase